MPGDGLKKQTNLVLFVLWFFDPLSLVLIGGFIIYF